MRKFHLVFGAAMVVAFLLTGQYMDRLHNHLEGVADGPRLLYRTRHIFILLSGLLHLGLGAYLAGARDSRRRVLQLTGSALLTLAPLLFLAGFFYEPHLAGLHTPLSHWGAYTIAAGTVLHLFGAAGREGAAS